MSNAFGAADADRKTAWGKLLSQPNAENVAKKTRF
jgi:hypothetical protein